MIVELKDVSKRYGTGPVSVTALHDVEFLVAPGEFVVVLGPSGSGKTTLLNIIGALDTATGGTVRVNNIDISTASRRGLFAFRRESVSFVFQSFNLFPSLTARENVPVGIDAADSVLDAAEVLDSVGLGDKLDRFPHELSGGEQQRVAISRALATNNPIMLADEPTGELDFETGIQILELLREQAGNGRAVLVVTHNREISRIADRVIELSSGQIVGDGPPQGGKADVADLHW